MLLRWISALIGIPLFLGACLWGAQPFAVGAVTLAVIGLREIQRTFRAQGLHPNPLLGILGLGSPGIGIFASPWELFHDYPLQQAAFVWLVGGLFAAMLWEVIAAIRTGEMRVAQNLGYGLLCGVYIALFGGMVWLRHLPGALHAGPFPNLELGAAVMLLFAFCVWATDSGSLFAGKAWGRRKLVPALSPQKTVEGAVGGLACGLLIGAGTGLLLFGSPWGGLLAGAIAGIVAPLGDLFESALKREAGVKDFGSLIPGHGGALDRFDSLMVVTSFATLLLVCFFRPPVH